MYIFFFVALSILSTILMVAAFVMVWDIAATRGGIVEKVFKMAIALACCFLLSRIALWLIGNLK